MVRLIPVHESNDCHNPPGPGGGQFCSTGGSTRPKVTYDRVTLKDRKVIYLRNLRHLTFLGEPAVAGVEINRYGEETEGSKGEQRRHLISTSEIKKIQPLRMDLDYQTLHPTTDDNRLPFHGRQEKPK